MGAPGPRIMNPNAVWALASRTRRFASVSHAVAFALVALVTLSIGRVADGQDLPPIPGAATLDPDSTVEPTSPAEIASRRASVDAELRALKATLADADSANAEHLRAVGERLQEIIGALEKQVAVASRAASGENIPPLPPVEGPSVFALNQLYDAQFLRREADRTHKDRIAASREALEAAKETLAAADRERRRARTELENAEASEKARARNSLELHELESRIAQEEVYLRRAEMLAARRDGEEPEVAELEGRIDEMRAALARGEGSSNLGFAALTKRAEELRRGREATERRLATADLELQAAQGRYVQEGEPSAESLARVESLIARRDAVRQEIVLIDAQLQRLDSERPIWSHWEALLRGDGSEEDLEGWKASVEQRIAALKQAEYQIAERASGLRLRIDRLVGQRSDLPAGSALHAVLEAELDTLSSLHEQQRAETFALAADRRMSERVLHDIYERTGRMDPLEYASRGVEAARSVWGYEITVVDDASITVGSVVLALLLLFLGMWAARRGSRFVASASRARFNLDTGAAHALETLSFYVLLVAFTLLALRAVHFPLTAFTVLGGALAIGVGFGSQNVMNNFISGLILMLDRPVRAHDVVEVDGNLGTVEKIGARSTQIRSTDGRHIIVPNSFFLESNVVNWTLSDDLIRAKVSVGVIYGSPTRLVEGLIRQVMHEDDQVLKVPEPIVVFEEFGDNSLNFDVYFWVRARSPMEMRTVQSRVRFRIDELFRDNELVIAFPQRDVHIDSAAPVEVRIVTDDGQTTSQSKREAT